MTLLCQDLKNELSIFGIIVAHMQSVLAYWKLIWYDIAF